MSDLKELIRGAGDHARRVLITEGDSSLMPFYRLVTPGDAILIPCP